MKRLSIVLSIGLLVSAVPTAMYAAAADQSVSERKSQEDLNRELLTAAETGNIANVSELLKQRADVNAQNAEGLTALILATFNSRTKAPAEVARLFLADNADVEAQKRAAFTCAAERNQTEIVKLLLANNAHIDAQDDSQRTALIWAAETGQTELVSLLLANNADSNVRNHHYHTALMLAAEKGFSEIARLLLKNKAQISLKNGWGKTALVCAVESPSFSAPTVRGLLCLSPFTEGISERCTIQSRLVFDEHQQALERLISIYNKTVEAGNIQEEKITDVAYAQQHIVQIIQTLFKDELGFLFPELALVMNENRECLFNLYFNPFE